MLCPLFNNNIFYVFKLIDYMFIQFYLLFIWLLDLFT